MSPLNLCNSRGTIMLWKTKKSKRGCIEKGFLLSKLFCIYLLLKKLINKKYFLINRKYFHVKEKFSLISKKVFSFYFGRKILSRNYEKFKNIILFADYVKFGPQTFDYYIFCLNFFSNLSLKIWFNLIFILIFMIVIYFYLIIF